MEIIKKFINKCLSLYRLGSEWCNKLITRLIEAGRTESYVETISPSQSDTLHKSIKGINVQTIMHEFENIVRWSLPLLDLEGSHVKLGIDVTEDSTWTKFGAHNVRPSSHQNMHHIKTWQYLNISIVDPFFLPLMSIPYRQIDDLDTLVIDLLKYVKTLPLIIDLVLFDRGFYHAHLIDLMENRRGKEPTPYLILVKKTKAVLKYISQTDHFDWYVHAFDYPKEKSIWHPSTTIIVWKPDPIFFPDVVWTYATNQNPTQDLVDSYPKRWGSENCFRVHDEGQIKSKSSNPIIRFFYHILGMVLIILWRTQSVSKDHIVYKQFLKSVEYKYRQMIIFEDPPPSIIIY